MEQGDCTSSHATDLQERAQAACSLLKAMSNENRLMILCNLVHGEKTVGELEVGIGLSQSALSQHLAVLRQTNLVSTRRNAQSIYYSLAGQEAKSVIETLYGIFSDEDGCCAGDT